MNALSILKGKPILQQVAIGLAAVAVLLIAIIFALGIVLSGGTSLQNVHVPSSFAEPFDYDNGSYEDYIAWSERRLRFARVDEPDQETLINLLPFELSPDADCPVNPDGKVQNGIVLVHGLIASPWSMKPMGEYFQSRCFHVMGVLMHGHGSRVGDMLVSKWQDWHRDLQFAVRTLSEKADRITLSGHSVGATLAVLEAAQNSDIDSLVLFGPAMAVDGAGKYARTVSQLGRMMPTAAWFELEPEDAVYRYESFPYFAAAETWDLVEATQEAILKEPLSIPVFTVASAQDTTVIAQATLDFMQGLENMNSHMVLYAQYDLPSYNRTSIIISNLPEQGIVSLGHLGLMTPPSHPHYGRNGAYRYCGQYYGEENDFFARCKSGDADFLGEATEENKARGVIERIAFNPFYDELLEELDLFIQQINLDPRGVPINPDPPDALQIDDN